MAKNFWNFHKISEKSLKPASCATWLTRAQNPKKNPLGRIWQFFTDFFAENGNFLKCTYGWFVPFSRWFSVQFYLGQFKLSRFLCGDFDFAIVAKNWHFFRVTLWYVFLQNRCFSHTAPNKSEMSETTWKWIQWKMASADWLIVKSSDVSLIRIGWG